MRKKPKPPKITDFSRALLEQVHNEALTRERVEVLEGQLKAICAHLGLKMVEEPEPKTETNLVPFAAAGEAVPSEESDVH